MNDHQKDLLGGIIRDTLVSIFCLFIGLLSLGIVTWIAFNLNTSPVLGNVTLGVGLTSLCCFIVFTINAWVNTSILNCTFKENIQAQPAQPIE